jgi:predicted AAA+ superfamily ATPase
LKSWRGGQLMLFRKISSLIEEHLRSDSKKILLIDGARQVGKTYIIRYVGKKLFKNFIEINMVEDLLGDRLFANIGTVDDFYLQVSMIAGDKMKDKENTLIFIDEIQAYPNLLTLLKFLSQDGRFTYIASGSLLGVTLSQTTSVPMGSIRKVRMFPLDFEEFLYANGMNEIVISSMKSKFEKMETLDVPVHNKIMDIFRKYLLTGGLPDAVNAYIETKNIYAVREIQKEIHEYYGVDASKYDEQKKLHIRKIYDMLPSNMENKKKRVVAQRIEGKKGKIFSDYNDEFEYLISSGIALDVQAIPNPVFPLIESSRKNLLKLYLNDVGILTGILYGNNIRAVLDDEKSINLGSVYETVVASELTAHGYKLFYYDNRSKGEVDYLIDDYDSLSVIPIEVKSGKDYTVHSALNNFVNNEDYHIKKAVVLSNEREVFAKGKIIYMPVYYVMFFNTGVYERQF